MTSNHHAQMLHVKLDTKNQTLPSGVSPNGEIAEEKYSLIRKTLLRRDCEVKKQIV